MTVSLPSHGWREGARGKKKKKGLKADKIGGETATTFGKPSHAS